MMRHLGHDEAGVVEVELQEVLLAQRPPRLRQQPHQLLLLQRLQRRSKTRVSDLRSERSSRRSCSRAQEPDGLFMIIMTEDCVRKHAHHVTSSGKTLKGNGKLQIFSGAADLEAADDGEAPDELRNQSVIDQVHLPVCSSEMTHCSNDQQHAIAGQLWCLLSVPCHGRPVQTLLPGRCLSLCRGKARSPPRRWAESGFGRTCSTCKAPSSLVMVASATAPGLRLARTLTTMTGYKHPVICSPRSMAATCKSRGYHAGRHC